MNFKMNFKMNPKMNFLFWITFFFMAVSVNVNLITDSTELLLQTEMFNISTYQEIWSTHTDRVTYLVTNARSELKSSGSIRSTTEYTSTDFIFFLKQYLPSWFYPPSVWKQDPITRRRNIARTLRSSNPVSRPGYVKLRDEVIEWTKNCNATFYNYYTVQTLEGLEYVLGGMMGFTELATKKEFMKEEFLLKGLASIDQNIDYYIKENSKEFDLMIKKANDEFNRIVTLGGELRLPLESIREDVINQTKHIRNKLFDQVSHSLRHLSFTIRANVQKLTSELIDADKTTAKALKKHTAKTISSELLYFIDVEITPFKLKETIEKVWMDASNELSQSPFTLDYWVDATAEIKEAIIKLSRIIGIMLKKLTKHRKCTII